MLPPLFSSGGGGHHLFCHEHVERASSVAIGDGKTELRCLADCANVFAINTLQKVLSAAAFAKWLEKIQLADIEQVSLLFLSWVVISLLAAAL